MKKIGLLQMMKISTVMKDVTSKLSSIQVQEQDNDIIFLLVFSSILFAKKESVHFAIVFNSASNLDEKKYIYHIN